MLRNSLDPDPGFFWIRIRFWVQWLRIWNTDVLPSYSRIQGLLLCQPLSLCAVSPYHLYQWGGQEPSSLPLNANNTVKKTLKKIIIIDYNGGWRGFLKLSLTYKFPLISTKLYVPVIFLAVCNCALFHHGPHKFLSSLLHIDG